MLHIIQNNTFNPDPKVKRIALTPKEYERLITEVWENSDKTCQNPKCRKYVKRNEAAVHHKKTKGAGGHDIKDNMELYCKECHGKDHNGEFLKKRKVGE